MTIRNRNRENVTKNKEEMLENLRGFLDSLINNGGHDLKRADLISYWIKTFIRFSRKEDEFRPERYVSYSRGDIVKVDFGYRIGNELGGLHYAIVIDNQNAKKSGTITVIPLSSIKPGKKIHTTSVLIGDELFKKMMSKHDRVRNDITSALEEYQSTIAALDTDDLTEISRDEMNNLRGKIDHAERRLHELEMLRKEIIRMKPGSIALVNQIATISKQRIYDPKYTGNVLYGIHLDDTTLSLINEKIVELYVFSK